MNGVRGIDFLPQDPSVRERERRGQRQPEPRKAVFDGSFRFCFLCHVGMMTQLQAGGCDPVPQPRLTQSLSAGCGSTFSCFRARRSPVTGRTRQSKCPARRGRTHHRPGSHAGSGAGVLGEDRSPRQRRHPASSEDIGTTRRIHVLSRNHPPRRPTALGGPA